MVGKIAEAASATIRNGKPVFLIDIDIDRFKQVNDSIGYSQGDQLIRAIARRLREILPVTVDMGRIGAGEFAVLIHDTPDMGPVDALVEYLMEKLMQPYQLPSHLQSVNLSVGIVAMPKDGIGNWSIFHAEMGKVAEYRQWIESELHLAFKRGDFDLHYQPQFDLPSGRIVGYETLVRWKHPSAE